MPPQVQKKTGDLATVSVGGPGIFITGTTTANSPAVTSATFTPAGGSATPISTTAGGLAVGMPIIGPGIPNGTTILTVGAGTLTLSNNSATATAGGLFAANQQQVLGLRKWSIDIKLATPDASTTDDFGWKSSLPSAKEWSGKATFTYLQNDPSQGTNLRTLITSLVNVPQRWNFYVDPIAADDCYYGSCYIDSLSFGAGAGEVVTYEVSFKGNGAIFEGQEAIPVISNTVTGLQAVD